MSATVTTASNTSNGDVEEKQKKVKESHIPVLSPNHFYRTGSLKLRNERRIPHRVDNTSTPTQPLRRHRSLQGLTSPILPRQIEKNCDRDDDLDSERSFGSSCNSLCGHSPFGHNGTTYSARNMKYVFHCSPNTGSDEYLTPTQRANRTIKRLRRMLTDAQAELLEKDNEISKLTKEIVELRLLKVDHDSNDTGCYPIDNDIDIMEPVVSKSGPRFMDVLLEERDNANLTENEEPSEPAPHEVSDNKGIFPRHVQHSPSLADSGNFEDINCTNSLEKEIERLRQNYDDMREKHNEKVEQLLKIIADSNDKYYEQKPKYDSAVIRIRELEKEIEVLKSTSTKQEDFQKNIYLQLYAKQLNPEKVLKNVEENLPAVEQRSHSTEEVSDLINNLNVARKELENVKAMYRALLDASKLKTGNDAEMTLRFLKTAVFYFLTDTTNSRDHLTAIESILGFSDDEKAKIEKVQVWKY